METCRYNPAHQGKGTQHKTRYGIPPHELVVMIKHVGWEDEGVMISVDYNRQSAGSNAHLKMLEHREQSKGFFFDSRVSDLVLGQLMQNLTDRMVNPASSCNSMAPAPTPLASTSFSCMYRLFLKPPTQTADLRRNTRGMHKNTEV